MVLEHASNLPVEEDSEHAIALVTTRNETQGENSADLKIHCF